MTIEKIVEKRKTRWAERHDAAYDKKIVEAAALEIVQSPETVKRIVDKPWLLIECCFSVVNKDGETVPFFLNEVQKIFICELEKHGVGRPYYVLKGRQQGFTTLITAIQLSFAIVRKNFSGFTVADCDKNTRAIFEDKARVVLDRLPEILRPSEKANNAYELIFSKLNSRWRISTATKKVGRSMTLSFVHFSEIAFYSCNLSQLQSAMGEAITKKAICVYETTANGFNEARELWVGNSCRNLFFGWWLTEEYRSENLEALETKDAWLRERLKLLESMGIDARKRAWYAEKYNAYIDKSLIRQEYPISPEEAFVSTGSCVFDTEKIMAQIIEAEKLKPKVGIFEYTREIRPIYGERGEVIATENTLENIRFIERADGYIKIFEEPKSREKNGIKEVAPYVLGGDTAGEGSDYYVGKMICNDDGRTAAVLHAQRLDEDIYAEQMLCLAKTYGDALIAIEANYSTHPIRVITRNYKYQNVYMREDMGGIGDKREMKYGFMTTSRTRPVIIGELITLMREEPWVEVDVDTLKEMLTFVRIKGSDRIEAEAGMHDDLVMATAIARHCAMGYRATWKTQTGSAYEQENQWLKDNFGAGKKEEKDGYLPFDEM